MSETQKMKWTTIKVPVELRDIIQNLAKQEDKPYWKFLTNCISWYVEQKRNPRVKEELPQIEKISWYIAKVSMSVGELKAKPTKENLQKLEKTLEQIEKRLGIKTDFVRRTVHAYILEPTTDNRMELNMALKMLIFDIIWYRILKEEAPKFNSKTQ